MKKFFPFLSSFVLVVTVFFATLSIQLIIGYFQDNFDNLNNNATTNLQSDQYAYYDYLFENFSAQNTKGENLILNQINSPILILEFWATWCSSCISEIPSIVELKKKYPDSYVRILAINGDSIFNEVDKKDLDKNINKLVREHNINFDIIIDSNNNGNSDSSSNSNSSSNSGYFEKFKVNSIPTTIIYVNGKTKFIHIGELNFNSKKLIAFLDENLKQLNIKLSLNK